MRLLNARTHRLETYPDHASRPRYAILSHTWAEEEVTFQDVEAAPPPTHMLGYKKVIGTCHRAIERGFNYVWVDTCCIDKTDPTELSVAINSMYQWYQDAEICFGYLSDVPFVPHDEQRQKKTFTASRWFQRGWTLQELLGPKHIIFFSNTWDEIGDRTSLSQDIGIATRIDDKFLRYTGREYLAEASIAEKMDWAATRTTSVTEDEAYCLLGIFGINMPLLYGEGRNAFLRLQEELIRRSDDQSIFAWGCDTGLRGFDAGAKGRGVLAESPAAFLGCSWVEYRGRNSHREPYSLLNTGISIKAPCSVDLTRPGYSHWRMMLRCGPKDDPSSVVTLPIHRIQDRGEFFSREWAPSTTPYSTCMRWKPKLITLSVQHDDDSPQRLRSWLPRSTPVWVKNIPPGFFITEFHPPAKWSKARVVQVPAPGRSAFKPFCRIRHRDSGAELTLVLINRWRFESLAHRLRYPTATRIKVILLHSADDPETCEVGTSHYTWPAGKTLMHVKTGFEPTTEGPLLTLSIEERYAEQRNWVLVQDILEQTVNNLVDIFNTLNGKFAEAGLDLREIGLALSLVFYTGVTEAGNAPPQALGRKVPSMSRELAPYFQLAVSCLLVFSTAKRAWVSPTVRHQRERLWPLLLLAASAFFAFDTFLSPYYYVWVILLPIVVPLTSFVFKCLERFWLLLMVVLAFPTYVAILYYFLSRY